ncbi:MAG: cyclic nucleotide-binding domain-containing protein [Alphaproteobacteria bacterium]|nr:cyclic nucleotide-binding domain-containing protein [Alphaproteobacteria bacterium]
MAEIPTEQILRFLQDAPMFGDLDEEELAHLVQITQIQRLGVGDWVFREGDPGDAWYVVFDGEVEVVKEMKDGVRIIAVLGKRACFGEMAILDGSPRSASVRATRDSVVFRFARTQFSALLASGNLSAYKLVHQMALVLVSRQRRTTHRLAELLGAVDTGLRERLGPLMDQSSVAE